MHKPNGCTSDNEHNKHNAAGHIPSSVQKRKYKGSRKWAKRKTK